MATFRDGKITVELDDTLEQLLRRAVEQARPGVLQQMEERTDEALAEIVAAWPVKSGRSRAGFRRETTFGPDFVTTRIVNRVDYARFVRPREFFGVTTGFARIVRPAMRRAANVLVRELGERVAANLEGRRG